MKLRLICTGTNIFISFLTPESEVYVLAPVKFIARKDDMATDSNSQPTVAARLNSISNATRVARNTEVPTKIPFIEKYLDGIHGKKIGVRNAPDKYEAVVNNAAMMARSKEKLTEARLKPVPMTIPMTNKTTARYFKELTISTGVRISLSIKPKGTVRIDSSAWYFENKYLLMSLAKTGPNFTLNPVTFFT